jgi:hypothetical protein
MSLKSQYISEYNTWKEMYQRCYNPNCHNYKYYGSRGIKICDRWLYSFENFINDMGPRPTGLTLERIDRIGDYEPDNCKWATLEEQNRNRNFGRREDWVKGDKNIIKSNHRRNFSINLNQAREIRKLYLTENYSQLELARQFNISQQNISRIILNELWKESEEENAETRLTSRDLFS